LLIKKIKATNFRNYTDLELLFDNTKHINIIHAVNGMGKSNLLEIIYYFTCLSSFRNVLDRDLIKKGEKSYFVEIQFIKENILNSISIKYDGKKIISANNKKVNKYSEIFGRFLSVFFGNDDIFIINGSPEIKRKFFDIFLSIIDKKYLFYLKKYLFIIKQKNFIIKQKKDKNLISVYNQQLGNVILYLQNKRIDLLNNINILFNNIYGNICMNKNETVSIRYLPSINISSINECAITEFLDKNVQNEYNVGFCLYGCHRDNYQFFINNIPFPKYASFGQMRLAALVLKLVQAEVFRQIFNEFPILLLDDVILELDKARQIRFLEFINKYKQVFVTFSNKEYIDLFNKKNDINEIEIENGQIKKSSNY
jgi:DNA replication and repair protein RecF